MRNETSRWLVAALATVGVVSLLAWARHDAGVDDRTPDPADVRMVVVVPADGADQTDGADGA